MPIRIEFDDDYMFEAYDGDKKVGELEIMHEWAEMPGQVDRHWLNGVYITNDAYHRQGIGTRLIQEAINAFGEIHISSASAWEHKQANDNSARELLNDGAHLVNSCIAQGIIQQSWMINPFN